MDWEQDKQRKNLGNPYPRRGEIMKKKIFKDRIGGGSSGGTGGGGFPKRGDIKKKIRTGGGYGGGTGGGASDGSGGVTGGGGSDVFGGGTGGGGSDGDGGNGGDSSNASTSMMVSFASSIAGKLLGSAAKEATTALWDHLYGHGREDHLYGHGGEDIQLVMGKLLFILIGLLSLSDSEQTEPWKKKWIVGARELVYDIEDFIGKFQHAGDKAKPEEMKIFLEEIMNSVKAFGGYFLGPFLYSDVIGGAKDCFDAMDMFRTLNNMSASSRREDDRRGRPLACSDSTGLVGVDGPTKKIISLLDIAGVPDAEQGVRGDPIGHKVVAIVGVGGLGKTTLAAHVCNEIAGKFHCEARVFVTRNREPREIMIDLLEEFGMNDCHHLQDGILVLRIQDYVEDKRYLVIFDDVWDNFVLEDVINVLFKNPCGGRIIITTRRNDVAEELISYNEIKDKGCCPTKWGGDYHVQPLNEEDSRKLLLQDIFLGKVQTSKDYVDKILAKCGGSPLALTAVSDVATRHGMEGHAIPWDEVYMRISEVDAPDDEIKNMRKDLSHSYFDLPYGHRDCFLYLSLFPHDRINKKQLVSRWVAEGLVSQDRGKETFEKLVKWNLILKPKIKYDGDESIYQVHPTIHDFVVWRSAEYNFITLPDDIYQTDRKIRRISVQRNFEGHENIKLDDKKLPDLRSLSMCEAGVPPKEMSSILRVLDLQDCNIGGVKPGQLFHHNLRYLKLKEGLEGLELKRIGTAKNLQTLDLRGLGKIALDEAVTDLELLVCLLVDPETTLPGGIGKLKALEELQLIDVFSYDVEFFLELAHLNKLKAMAIRLPADNSVDKEEMLSFSLLELTMQSLFSLSIYGVDTGSITIHSPQYWGQAIMGLRKLRMMGCPFSKFLEFQGENRTSNLRRLKLGLTSMDESTIQAIRACASRLSHLFLDLSGDMKCSFADEGFYHLTCLGIRSSGSNIELTFSMGSPQHLKFQLNAHECTMGTEALPDGFYYDTDPITFRNKTPSRLGNDKDEQATTWTAVHIITPARKGNDRKEVMVAIKIEDWSATLSIKVNESLQHDASSSGSKREDMFDINQKRTGH